MKRYGVGGFSLTQHDKYFVKETSSKLINKTIYLITLQDHEDKLNRDLVGIHVKEIYN